MHLFCRGILACPAIEEAEKIPTPHPKQLPLHDWQVRALDLSQTDDLRPLPQMATWAYIFCK